MKLAERIAAIEARRGSRVLVLAASNLELELLPALYDALREIGPAERLDVVFQCRGGAVVAARRIGLLLHAHTERLGFVVAHHCQSAGTITALAARELVAGPVAIFSPVDPMLQAEGGGPGAVAAEDVRRFGEMAQAWFGVDPAEADRSALAALGQAIFPPTLTAFYRAAEETRAVCEELLALHLDDPTARTRIAEQLITGFHSHEFPIGRDDLAALGLPVTRDPATEDDAWEIARELRAHVGGGVRGSPEDDWVDTVIATREGLRRRRRNRAALEPQWEAGRGE